MNHPPSRVALFRLWIAEHDSLRVLAFASLVIALCYGVYFYPLGPPEHAVGVVQSVQLGPFKSFSKRAADVRLGSRTIMVTIYPNTCEVGETIVLVRQRRLWGYSVTANQLGCSAPRVGSESADDTWRPGY